jgi:16S rRNA (cytosine967-C5)-methyltransferase
VLRRLAAEHGAIPLPALRDDPLGHLMHSLSLPMWIAARWIELYGPGEAALLARASNDPPPLAVRANPLRTTPDELLAELRERFPDAQPCRIARNGIVLGRRGNAALDRAFVEGRFTVQDEGSQLVVDLLDPQPDERVLDACAAPGGKATAIAERVGPGGDVLAIDRNARRIELVRRAARRLGLSWLRCEATPAAGPGARSRPSIACWSTYRVRVSARCDAIPTPAGASARRTPPCSRMRNAPS